MSFHDNYYSPIYRILYTAPTIEVFHFFGSSSFRHIALINLCNSLFGAVSPA